MQKHAKAKVIIFEILEIKKILRFALAGKMIFTKFGLF
jgi:hypothetical protein